MGSCNYLCILKFKSGVRTFRGQVTALVHKRFILDQLNSPCMSCKLNRKGWEITTSLISSTSVGEGLEKVLTDCRLSRCCIPFLYHTLSYCGLVMSKWFQSGFCGYTQGSPVMKALRYSRASLTVKNCSPCKECEQATRPCLLVSRSTINCPSIVTLGMCCHNIRFVYQPAGVMVFVCKLLWCPKQCTFLYLGNVRSSHEHYILWWTRGS